MILYHYTSLENLEKIISDGYLKLTASNLLEPKNPKVENGILVDVTDSFKPVVWFSDDLDFDRAIDNGLKGSRSDKTAVAIAICNANTRLFKRWDKWAKENNIKDSWFRTLKWTAPNWRTFYISELTVYLNDWKTEIIYRPDVIEKLKR